MTEQNTFVQDAVRAASRVAVTLLNQRRAGQDAPDYVQIMLPEDMPVLPEKRSFVQSRLLGNEPDMSLWELKRLFERVAADPRPRGVILQIRGFRMSMADLQTLRATIRDLRARGKRVVAYAMEYDLATYYVASATDEIIMQPGGTLMTLGLLRQQVYMREGLEHIGVEADAVAISPYKGAADTFTRDEPSDEGREQTEWLLNSTYHQIVNDIADTRRVSSDDVHGMIDNAPHVDHEALANDYIDAIVNEEGLAAHLNVDSVQLWDEAEKVIYVQPPEIPTDGVVAVLRVGGMMVPGESNNPPVDIPVPLLGGERMGDLTVVRQARNIMKDKNVKALVLVVDSPGGSATAAEAMTSALNELSKQIPIVVYMNGVAASGGYYISTVADWIVAQPGTITGSIGVLALKMMANETLKKIKFNPVYFMRGKNADLFAPIEPFSDTQRALVRKSIEATYELFMGRVADARKMKRDEVDAVSGGRVWTGQQALEHGLVDQLGGLEDAIDKAKELAKLPQTTPATIIREKGKPLPAQIADQINPAASLHYMLDTVEMLTDGSALMLMPFEWH